MAAGLARVWRAAMRRKGPTGFVTERLVVLVLASRRTDGGDISEKSFNDSESLIGEIKAAGLRDQHRQQTVSMDCNGRRLGASPGNRTDKADLLCGRFR